MIEVWNSLVCQLSNRTYPVAAQGSEFALGAKNGALSREDYANVSDRKTSFASQRDRVYDLYEIYRKRKRELGGYDAAERYVIFSLVEKILSDSSRLTELMRWLAQWVGVYLVKRLIACKHNLDINLLLLISSRLDMLMR